MSAHHNVAAIVFFAFFVWIASSTLYKRVKYRGLAASGLRAPIERTIGRFTMDNGTKVEVHQLGGTSPERAIGIVFSKAEMPVLVIATSISEARKLATLVALVGGGDDAQ